MTGATVIRSGPAIRPEDGRLVMTLLLRGWSRTWELDHGQGHLVSRSHEAQVDLRS